MFRQKNFWNFLELIFDNFIYSMKIIVGLGNPGKKYERTRHNAGWLVLDLLVADLGFKIENFRLEKKIDSEILLQIQSQNITDKIASKIGIKSVVSFKNLFAKPQSFMNESGSAVKKICDFYKIDVNHDLLVIHDDSDLPLGTIRATNSASSAGHNGVQDIIDKLGTQDFYRIRIGVESRASRNDMPTDAFVLQNFGADEIKKLQNEVFPKIKEEIEKFLNY